jgi:hypothetical protein
MPTTTASKPARTPRQHAGNNAFLRDCRKAFNDHFYKKCLEMVNDPTQGEAAAREFLLKNVTRTLNF